jgi:hypothetical protein
MLKQAVLKRAITGYQGNHAAANKVTVVKMAIGARKCHAGYYV